MFVIFGSTDASGWLWPAKAFLQIYQVHNKDHIIWEWESSSDVKMFAARIPKIEHCRIVILGGVVRSPYTHPSTAIYQ